METSLTIRSHPHLRQNVVFLLNTPPRVKWEHIVKAMEPCGKATNALFNNSGRQKTWKIQFDSVVEGECLTLSCLWFILTPFVVAKTALSTLHGSQIDATHGLRNPHAMELSATEKPTAHKPDVHPILVPSVPGLGRREDLVKEFLPGLLPGYYPPSQFGQSSPGL
jgi:hypothetical protein